MDASEIVGASAAGRWVRIGKVEGGQGHALVIGAQSGHVQRRSARLSVGVTPPETVAQVALREHGLGQQGLLARRWSPDPPRCL